MKIALLTSSSLRHKYVAHCLAEKLQLTAIVVKSTSNSDVTYSNKVKVVSLNDNSVLVHHNQNRFAYEYEYFGSYDNFPEVPIHFPNGGQVNTPETLNFLLKYQPDLVLLFGSSIVKSDILSAFPNRVLNLHLGLSPYYRGSATNLVPLADGLPECVGATFHQAVLKVDAGHIVHQFRPQFNVDDNPHTIGNNTLKAAGGMYAEVAKRYYEGLMPTVPQTSNVGKLTTVRDISAELLTRMYRNFKNGMMANFLEQYDQRVAMYPIVQAI